MRGKNASFIINPISLDSKKNNGPESVKELINLPNYVKESKN